MFFKRHHKKEVQKATPQKDVSPSKKKPEGNKGVTPPNDYGENKVVGLPKDVKLTITGKNNRVIFGEKFKGPFIIEIEGDNNLAQIGHKCHLKKSAIRIRTNDAKVVIGNKTTCGSDCRFVTREGRSIYLGEDCMLSSNVHIRTYDGHSIIDTASGERINPAKDIVIGNHVWIGFNSIVLKGAKVADNCILAAASLLSKEYNTPGCVLAGVPVRVVREGITWDRKII